MSTRGSSPGLGFWLASLVLVLTAVFMVFHLFLKSGTSLKPPTADRLPAKSDPSANQNAPTRDRRPPTIETSQSRSSNGGEAASHTPCDDAFAGIRLSKDAQQRALLLRELEEKLRRLGSAEAFRQIRGFLNSGRDASTGDDFAVGTGGNLKASNSFRVALLDLAGRLDVQEAARLALDILRQPTTPEEWAVSLRNYARASEGAESLNYLKTKTVDLIRHPTWRQRPSPGYFEAFDLLVHTRATDTAPLLAELVTNDRRDLNYAAFLTMDRLVISSTGTMLEQLSRLSPTLRGRPEMVAGMFARADVRDASQRNVLERWLASPDRTEVEWEAFAGVYPNANALVSENLVTTSATPGQGSLLDHDRAALEWLERTMNDARFGSRRGHMEAIRQRLRRFVAAGMPQ